MTISTVNTHPLESPQRHTEFSAEDKIYAIAGRALLVTSLIAGSATIIVGCIVTIPPIGVALATLSIFGMFMAGVFIVPIPVQVEEAPSLPQRSKVVPIRQKVNAEVKQDNLQRAHAILDALSDNPKFVGEAASTLETLYHKYKAKDNLRIAQFKKAYLPELKKDLKNLQALAACFPDTVKSSLNGATAEILYKQIDDALLLMIENGDSIRFAEDFISALFHASTKDVSGLVNTGNSCFMNASLQAIFADETLFGYVLASLDKLSHDETLKERNPNTVIGYTLQEEVVETTRFGKTIKTTSVNRAGLPDERVAVTHLSKILADTSKHTEIFRGLHKGALEKLSDTEPLDDFNQRKLFAGLTLQEAAQKALMLLTKLKDKTPLSSHETILLKLALIKLTVTHTRVTVTLRKDAEPKVFLELSKAISPFRVQEDSAEMVRLLIDSLRSLQKGKDPLPCPCLVTTEKTFLSYADKACTTPTDSETIFEEDIILPTTLVASSTERFIVNLGDPESLSNHAPGFNKVTRTPGEREITEPVLEGDAPVTGDHIRYVRSHTKVTLPETLIITPPPSNESGPRIPHLKFAFSDPEALTFNIQNNKIDSLKTPTTYKLESFTLHSGGSSLDGGHYIAYSRKVDETTGCEFWVESNDSTVRRVPEILVKSLLAGERRYESANVLIFKKV